MPVALAVGIAVDPCDTAVGTSDDTAIPSPRARRVELFRHDDAIQEALRSLGASISVVVVLPPAHTAEAVGIRPQVGPARRVSRGAYLREPPVRAVVLPPIDTSVPVGIDLCLLRRSVATEKRYDVGAPITIRVVDHPGEATLAVVERLEGPLLHEMGASGARGARHDATARRQQDDNHDDPRAVNHLETAL